MCVPHSGYQVGEFELRVVQGIVDYQCGVKRRLQSTPYLSGTVVGMYWVCVTRNEGSLSQRSRKLRIGPATLS